MNTMNMLRQDMMIDDNKEYEAGGLTVRRVRTLRPMEADCQHPLLVRLLLLLLMLVGGGMEVVADDVIEDGYYYIRNTNNAGYYLCPAWSYYYNDDAATPYLTTYTTGTDNNSIWHIIKVMDGEDAYYRLLHVATGKYLTANDPIDGLNTGYLRLHLEASDDPGDATLFIAKKNTNGNLAFRSKSYYSTGSNSDDYYWLDISSGNKSNYNNGNYQGALGFWYKLSEGLGTIAKWALEEADQTWSTPVITYDGSTGTFTLTYPVASDGVTLHYTTDGSTPTESSTSCASGTVINVSSTSGVLRAIAVKDGYTSAVAEVYTPNYPVMLRNGGNSTTSYYLCPPMPTETKDLYATTSNVPTQYLAWQLQYEGMEDGRAIYTLKNQATGKYLYCRVNTNAGNAYEMKDELDASGTEADRYRFYFTPVADGTFNLISKNFGYAAPNSQICMYKDNNDNGNYLKTDKDNANGYPRWTVVAADPKTYSEIDFASTADEKHYFKIQNVSSNDYYLNPGVVGGSLVRAFPSANSEYDVWYMEKATDDDQWATYYYIRNATTGDYLYFKGNVNTDNTFFTSGSIPDGTERDYKFIIVRTAGTSASDNNSYHIIPKSLRERGKQESLALTRNSTTNLKAGNSRGQAAARWNFVAVGVDDIPSRSAAPVNITDGSDKHIYYLQSVANTNFYLIPGPANGDDYYVNTLSLPRPSMQWYFKDAGTDGGVQYYYIVNNHVSNTDAEADGYLYYNSDNNARVKTTFDESDKDNYCFAVVPHYNGSTPDGTYNIVAKAKIQADVALTARALYKNGDNQNTANVSTNGTIENALGRWNFVTEKPTVQVPFDLYSDGDATTTYYCIGNVGQTGYIAPPTATSILLAETAGSDEAWYFKDAVADNWLTYYYIVHAATGKYLYFNGTNTNNIEGAVWMSASDKTPENEDRYQFAIATTTTEGQYYIIPKTNKYAFNQQYYVLYKDNNKLLVKTNSWRGDNRGKWTFAEYTYKCATPTFSYSLSTRQLTISCSTPGVTIRYTIDGSNPTVSTGTEYTGTFTLGESVSTVNAVAYRNTDGSDLSDMGEFTFNEISSTSQITSMGGYYVLASGFTAESSVGTEDNPFTGTIDGGFNAFSLNSPLIAYAQDATIKNVIISKATISGSENVGAIANIAKGNTRIYNCGILDGTVSGTGNVGGLVGKLDGSSRVINCYSYADITGGTTVGGIVGYNNCATTQTDLRTMVMNCMMYGDISGNDVYPVYGGQNISNKETNGVNNYNFYRDESKINVADLNHYHCSWPVEEKYLTRFDYVRSVLNSNRELCAWWITGNADDKNIVAKWVYAPQEATYPILKLWGRYPSMINRDIDGKSLYPREGANDYEGKKLGTLSVTVQNGRDAAAAAAKTLTKVLITDMDTLHYDYGYYKIQLPYYNDVFGNSTSSDHATRYGGNYTADQVVVGWEVTEVEGGTTGTFSKNSESGNNYNFADRYCTDKDKYKVSGRVFAQGGYYYVPEGVTAITIKAHWAKAYYCANTDFARDRIDFVAGSGATNPSTPSRSFIPSGTIENTFYEQPVYAGLVAAQNAIESTGGTTVYDNAIVLVGNVQHRNGTTNNLCVNGSTKGFTIMSVDLDFDDEPDYALPLQVGQGSNKASLSPIRFDFVQAPDLGIVLKRDGDKNRLAVSCIYMYGHFEITETSALHFNELYFGNCNDKLEAPIILNGGQTLEFVAGETNKTQNKTQYIIAGGNVHMRSLYQGNHNKQSFKIKHAPMSVMGGEFDECYLSGNLRSMATTAVWQDSPWLYTNGGRFGIIAGAGQESVNGDVHFRIDHSIIDEFYGGATSSGGVIAGNIDVQIDHSLVTKYCGGPMVGDMPAGKTITTRATGTTFTEFYGAGNGGTSFTLVNSQDFGAEYSRSATDDQWKLSANYSPMAWNSSSYKAKYHFEIWQVPSGTSAACASRRYVYGAQFAATKTGSVTSTLKECTFKGNFYGGGNLGAVEGDVTSTLTDCTVEGSVFGAGYSATIPSFECYLLPPESYPWQDPNTSICHDYVVGKTESYTWTNEGSKGEIIEKGGIKYAHTDISLSDLGKVTGDVKVNIDGTTHVAGSVFGGGDESGMKGDTTVTLTDDAEVDNNVYGGGNKASVDGSTQLFIQ